MTPTEDIRLEEVNDKESLAKVFDIRRKVFQIEQGIKEELDFDGQDKNAKQILLIYKGTPIGCARIRLIDNKAKLERIAVLSDFRGKGFGKILMNYLIAYSKNHNVDEIYFDAQQYLESFYGALGFKREGDPFEEVGIQHIKMKMKIK